ncbi:MAG TPA: RNA polymerase sigma factor [Candidatus Dojkabacteria bacterium]|jgi:RNA polymerase sigma-70 factor (ECF subfamily)
MNELTNQEIEKLVEQAKSEMSAFNSIYQYFLPKIYGYVYNRVNGDRHVCEDLTSMIFEAVVLSLPNYRVQEGGTFKAFIYRIAHNKVIDYYNKNKRGFLSIFSKKIENEPSFENDPQDTNILESEIIKKELSNLRPKDQLILSLKYYSELENNEIAEVLDTKVSNVSVLIHRALKKLREKVKSKLL